MRLQPRLVGGGRDKADQIEALRLGRHAQHFIFFRRQIDHDQAVHAGRRRIAWRSAPCHRHGWDCNSPSARSASCLSRLAEFAHHLEQLRPWWRRLSARAATRPAPPGHRPSDRRTACPARSHRRRAPAAFPEWRSEVSRSGSPAVMKGTKAARPAFFNSAKRCGDAAHSFSPSACGDREHILVAAARQADRDDLVLAHLRRDLGRHGRGHAPIPAPG